MVEAQGVVFWECQDVVLLLVLLLTFLGLLGWLLLSLVLLDDLGTNLLQLLGLNFKLQQRVLLENGVGTAKVELGVSEDELEVDLLAVFGLNEHHLALWHQGVELVEGHLYDGPVRK